MTLKRRLQRHAIPRSASPSRALTLRATDQETARVVAVHRQTGEIVGAGCLIDDSHVLTCRHVVAAALGLARPRLDRPAAGRKVFVTLAGASLSRTVVTKVVRVGPLGRLGSLNDLALLQLAERTPLAISPVEFASPLRHGGKGFSVLGFPLGDRQGRNVVGRLHAADAMGLVQMDRGGALSVLGGFSGAPVWSPDLNAFVGIVVTELSDDSVAWCIPSRQLCAFYPQLRVRFRICRADRPEIHDYWDDDPNVDLFGSISDIRSRRLLAEVDHRNTKFRVKLRYECSARRPPIGHFVTFITYPDFAKPREDAYELFADVRRDDRTGAWFAEQTIKPNYLFTVAAIGDGGATALTLNLEDVHDKSRSRK
jgi:Trypsin-like peptidase domain